MIVRLKNNKKTPISTLKKSKNFKEGKSMQVHFSECSPPDQLKKSKKSFKVKIKNYFIKIQFLFF